ncbi:hypothetical protein S2091_0735 [Solimicrobium silvestre]|uniref:Uncharacterized protein n=2 Tax=Solimicrobium silvestre TaxID=2099400 RepID=A0A2S9H428_9BURK|nr:hypothetical protein S2091_0735 [Solimicrobium silvestre]
MHCMGARANRHAVDHKKAKTDAMQLRKSRQTSEELNMQMTAADIVWIKGQASYEDGDTPEQAGIKALQHGYLPESESYAGFGKGIVQLIEPGAHDGSDS